MDFLCGSEQYFFSFEKKINFIKRAAFLLLVLTLGLSPAAKADEPSLKSETLQPCWRYATDNPFSSSPLSYRETLYLPQTDGTFLALDTVDGETLWRANLGGTIEKNISANDKAVFVASQITTDSQAARVIVRALSRDTGITLWQIEFGNAQRAALAQSDNHLIVALRENGSQTRIISLSIENGTLVWEQKLSATLLIAPLIGKNEIFAATVDNALHKLKTTDGALIARFKLPFSVSQIVLETGVLLISDATGKIAAVRETDGKVLWKTRFGGAVQSLTIIQKNVLIASLDNFIYFHQIAKGKRLWRRRLNGRPLGASRLENGKLLLTVTGENKGTVISAADGKIENQLIFGTDETALAAPLKIGSRIIIFTNKGIAAFVQNPLDCPQTEKSAS